MRFSKRLFVIATAACMLIGLVGTASAQNQDGGATYQAELSPVNADTVDAEPTGEATFTVSGDELMIRVAVEGVPPDMEHWQHLHGFVEVDQEAECVTPDADTNGDGIVDLIETEPVSGVTMIPLHDDPVSLEIPRDTYPVADSDGTYTYEMTVSLDALNEAFSEQFPEDAGELNLENRVIYVHGVPDSTELPDSVASIGDIPAHVTLPIACGELALVDAGTPGAATPVATPAN